MDRRRGEASWKPGEGSCYVVRGTVTRLALFYALMRNVATKGAHSLLETRGVFGVAGCARGGQTVMFHPGMGLSSSVPIGEAWATGVSVRFWILCGRGVRETEEERSTTEAFLLHFLLHPVLCHEGVVSETLRKRWAICMSPLGDEWTSIYRNWGPLRKPEMHWGIVRGLAYEFFTVPRSVYVEAGVGEALWASLVAWRNCAWCEGQSFTRTEACVQCAWLSLLRTLHDGDRECLRLRLGAAE